MTFAEFCMKKEIKKPDVFLTMQDIDPDRKKPKTLKEKELDRLRNLITEFEIKKDTYFEKISIHEERLDRYCPDDEAYLLGRSRRGVWIVCDGCDIYVVSRGKPFDRSAMLDGYNVKRAASRIFRTGYSVTGSYAM